MSQFVSREMITTVLAVVAVLSVLYLFNENKKMTQKYETTNKSIDEVKYFISSNMHPQGEQSQPPPAEATAPMQTQKTPVTVSDK